MLFTKWSELLSLVSLSGHFNSTQHHKLLVNNRSFKKMYYHSWSAWSLSSFPNGWRPWFTEFKDSGILSNWWTYKWIIFLIAGEIMTKKKQSECLFLVIIQVHRGDKSIMRGTCSSWSYSVPKLRSRAGWEMNVVAQLSPSFYLFSIQPGGLVSVRVSPHLDWIFPP